MVGAPGIQVTKTITPSPEDWLTVIQVVIELPFGQMTRRIFANVSVHVYEES